MSLEFLFYHFPLLLSMTGLSFFGRVLFTTAKGTLFERGDLTPEAPTVLKRKFLTSPTVSQTTRSQSNPKTFYSVNNVAPLLDLELTDDPT